MRNMYRIKAFSVMAWWIACSLFIWPFAAIVLALVLVPSALVYNNLTPSYYSSYYGIYEFIGVAGAIPLIGALIGFSMAHLQRWLLRSKLYWEADNWRKWSMLGGAVGAGAVAFMSLFADNLLNNLDRDISPLLIMSIFIGVVSAFQYLSLRHVVKDAWLWILGNIVAGIVFGGLLISNPSSRYSYEPDFGVIMLAAASLGVITGYVMLFLFEKKLLPMQTADVSVPVDPNRPKSVWDDVV